MRFLRCVVGMLVLVVAALGCDQLNKPIRPLRNPPRRPSTAVPSTLDAGAVGDAEAPAPSITPQPGDLHL